MRLLLFIFFISPGICAASMTEEKLQDIRLAGFSVCSNLLVFYNPTQTETDARYSEEYLRMLAKLEILTKETGDPVMQSAVRDIKNRATELTKYSHSESELYPNTLNPLLEAHARLDKEASSKLDELKSSDKRTQTLHSLQLNIEKLLLIYETRTFGSLAVYFMPMDDNTFYNLDSAILSDLNALSNQWPEHSDQISKIHTKYEYIRPRLLQHDKGWIPAGAAYYMSKISESLSEIK